MSWPRTLAPVVGALCLALAPDARGDDAQGKVAALMNLARCQEARGQLVGGLDRYREARAQMDADDARAATVDERITALALRIAHAQLDWSKAPEGCELRLDGALVEGRPTELALDPGEHVLEVRSPNAVLLGVGLAGVATGLILYFTAPPSPTGPMLGLDVSPSGATLSLGGRF